MQVPMQVAVGAGECAVEGIYSGERACTGAGAGAGTGSGTCSGTIAGIGASRGVGQCAGYGGSRSKITVRHDSRSNREV